MKFYYISIVLVIASNVIYHISQKSVPQSVNPMVALIVTYASALFFSIAAAFIFPGQDSIQSSFKSINWASFLLGFAIVGLEAGFLLAYRAGWNISTAGLYANVIVAILLIPVGILFYREHLSTVNVVGILLSILGLVLITKK